MRARKKSELRHKLQRRLYPEQYDEYQVNIIKPDTQPHQRFMAKYVGNDTTHPE